MTHAACACLIALLPAVAAAQAAPSAGAAATYMERYQEVMRIGPAADRVAEVSDLVITRDVGRLTLSRGRLYLLEPIGGRTVGAVFRGEGRFTFAPTVPAEQAMLRRFADSTALDAAVTEAVLIFADSTLDQLGGLTFVPGIVPGGVGERARDLVNSLKGEKEGSFYGSIMEPLLNGETNGLFAARLTRSRGDPVLFLYDPSVAEAVQLRRPVSRTQWGTSWTEVTQFQPQVPLPRSGGQWSYRERLRAPRYRVETRLTEAFSANVGLSASATVAIVATEPVGPWLRFSLHWKLDVDSARWSGGESAPVFKADDDGDLWVRAPRRLEAGDSLELTVHYRGSLIDRYGNFFYVNPAADWYPANAQGPELATFDLTFRSPARYPLVCIGELVDSSVADNVRTTHWITRRPTRSATFNLGLFETYRVQHEGAPPLEIAWSDDAHRLLRQEAAREGFLLLEQRNMRQNVAADVSNSLRLFTSLFGAPASERFAVTEIPYLLGVSFPGMIYLSFSTFSNTSQDGFDEFFRAHEAAHQWWGNGVRSGSYRDAWLSEGLATLSGLMYLQAERRRNTDYYRFLDDYRTDILARRADSGPIWIGWRTSTPDVPRGYDVLIYEKGAWVFQMLRAMMLDLATMRADRFTALLRDYYRTFNGDVATTEDFQNLVERHVGSPMGWFFDQWVRGTAIPTYRVAWTSQPAEGGRFQVRLRITQQNAPPDFRMPVIVAVDLGDQRTARFRVTVTGSQRDYVSPLLPAQPRGLVFNDLHSVLATVDTEGW